MTNVITLKRNWETRKEQQDRENLRNWLLTIWAVLLLMCVGCIMSRAEELPDLRVDHVDNSVINNLRDGVDPFVGENNVVHNSPSTLKQEHFHNLDWQFLTAHGVYAASTAFDLTLTKIGVSHGCQEANYALGPYPSTGRIVGYGLGEVAAITALDYALHRTHVRGLSYVGATIGTIKHISGGRQWLNQGGCL